MLKLAAAASAVAVAGATVYLVSSHEGASSPAPAPATAQATPVTISPVLRLGGGQLGLAHAPALGPTTAPRAIASRSVAEADLGYLPADADTVIGVNFASVRQSALWQRFVAPQLTGAGALREVEALCGFDPLTSLGSISIGLKGLGNDDDSSISGTIVIHGFDKAKAMSCFDKQGLAEAERGGAKITIDKDVVLLTDAEQSYHSAFTFIDATTALIVLGPAAATTEGVARIAAGNGTLATSSAFVATLQNINTDDSFWLMLGAQSPILKSIELEVPALADVKLGTLYLSLNVTDALALDAGVHLGAPEKVARVVAYLQDKMSEGLVKTMLASYFDQLDVFADGSDLVISVTSSGDQIAQMLSTVMPSSGAVGAAR